MVSFEAVDSQCIVDNKIVFCNNLPEEQKETMIYLSSQRGGDTLYGTDTTHVVTYP